MIEIKIKQKQIILKGNVDFQELSEVVEKFPDFTIIAENNTRGLPWIDPLKPGDYPTAPYTPFTPSPSPYITPGQPIWKIPNPGEPGVPTWKIGEPIYYCKGTSNGSVVVRTFTMS